MLDYLQVQTDKGEKGEDWEHEDEHADDDLEQGEDEGSDQENPPNAAQRCRVMLCLPFKF